MPVISELLKCPVLAMIYIDTHLAADLSNACAVLNYVEANFNCLPLPEDPEPDPVTPGDTNDDWIDDGGNTDDPDEVYDEYQRKPIWWYHTDHLGSSTYLTDNFGRPSHYYETLPFGEMMVEHNQSKYYKSPYPTSNIGKYDNKFKFNGKELDDATGMYYYGARYYDPRVSIMISVDQMVESTMTPYQYVTNNPIMFTDPTGMEQDDIIFKGTDNNEVRVIAPGDDIEVNLPVPLGVSGVINPDIGNINDIVDTNRFVWGYTIGADANMGLGMGAQWGGEVSIANFSDNTYGGYNYVYPGVHINKTIGAKIDASASAGVSLFVGYNDSKEPINPKGFAGTTYSYNFSADIKDVVGGGFTISGFSSVENPFKSKGWKGVSVGVSIGGGFTANAGSIGQQISKTMLLNNVKPTSQRSLSDRISNAAFPITSSLIQATRN